MPGLLGTPAKVKVVRYQRESIHMGFVGKKVFTFGEPVQIQPDGEVDSVSDSRKIIGYVLKPNKAIGGDLTVTTSVIMEAVGQAGSGAAVATGDLVKIDASASQSNGVPTYVTAASTNVAIGICLSGAAANGAIVVGSIPPVIAA